MKNLFLYYLKKRIPILLTLTVLLSIITLIYLFQSTFVRYVRDGEIIRQTPGDNPFIYLSIIFILITAITPIFEFAFKMRKSSIDLFYSLPIKRIKLFLVKYLFGLCEILMLCIIQWMISYIFLLASENLFDLYHYLVYGAAAICFIIMLYSTLVFFFTMGNTIIDGILNMVMATCALPFVVHTICLLISKFNSGLDISVLYMRYYFLFAPIVDTSMKLYYNMCGTYFDTDFYKIHWLALSLNIFIAIASFILFIFVNYNKNKAENVTEDSDSLFGYRVFLPMYCITGFCMAGRLNLLWIVVPMAGYIGYAIFRKTFKIKKQDMFSLGISILIGLVLAIVL